MQQRNEVMGQPSLPSTVSWFVREVLYCRGFDICVEDNEIHAGGMRRFFKEECCKGDAFLIGVGTVDDVLSQLRTSNEKEPRESKK